MKKTQRQQPTQGWMMGAMAMLALMPATATLLPLSAFAGTGDSGNVHQNVPAGELLRFHAW